MKAAPTNVAAETAPFLAPDPLYVRAFAAAWPDRQIVQNLLHN